MKNKESRYWAGEQSPFESLANTRASKVGDDQFVDSAFLFRIWNFVFIRMMYRKA